MLCGFDDSHQDLVKAFELNSWAQPIARNCSAHSQKNNNKIPEVECINNLMLLTFSPQILWLLVRVPYCPMSCTSLTVQKCSSSVYHFEVRNGYFMSINWSPPSCHLIAHEQRKLKEKFHKYLCFLLKLTSLLRLQHAHKANSKSATWHNFKVYHFQVKIIVSYIWNQ